MSSDSFKVVKDRVWVYLWADFNLNMRLRYLDMHESELDEI